MWARPSGLRTFEATFTFTFITARRLVVSPRETLSIGFRVLVSRHPAIQTTGLLTFAPAGLSPAEHASLRWTHNRTCGSPASGSRTGFATGSREDVGSATMAQSRHAEFAEDRFRAERSDASLGRLVTSDEEMAHAVVDMSADGAVRAIMRAGAEVAAPAAQE